MSQAADSPQIAAGPTERKGFQMVALSLGEVLLRLGMALALGAGVGIERERRRSVHLAGMRTLALVSMGSAFFTIISAHGFVSLTGKGYAPVDPTRIAAQIVTGVGFLGAGTILLQRQVVRGLTTAAAIWMMAAIGMACGAGLLLEAVGASALALVVLALLRPIERLIVRRPLVQRLRISLAPNADGEALDAVHAACEAAGVPVDAMTVRQRRGGDVLDLECRPPSRGAALKAVAALRGVAGVRAVQTRFDGDT